MSRVELMTAGVTRREIGRRTADGRLQVLHPGVYAAVGHRVLRPEGYRRAAVLAGGAGAVLSHRSGAEAWGWRPNSRAKHEITIPAPGNRRLPALTIHRCRLDADDVTVLDEIPITTGARTLLDLAEVVPADHLDRALDEAVRRGHYDERALDDVLERARHRRGRRRLRQALERMRPDAGRTRSAMEWRTARMWEAHGLPAPRLNAQVHGWEVDALWPGHRVARTVAATLEAQHPTQAPR